MSSIIWTQCGGKSNLKPLAQTAWRVVEDQSKVATRKLVDSDAEQLRLEQLIETVKPPLPIGPEWSHLHYLLFTPFRYPPLRHGSRFGTRDQRGIWYGSATIETAMAEVAYWRLRFLNDTTAEIRLEVILTAFMVECRSNRAIDLLAAPFSAFEDRISSPTSYADSQSLGTEMRLAGTEFCRYISARDTARGQNVAVFSPAAFVSKTVSDNARENWYTHATKTAIGFRRQGFGEEKRLSFQRPDFEVDGHLPML